jgi:hypothetical protein
MSDNTANDGGVSSPAEIISVDFQLQQLLELANFPTAKTLLHLEYLVQVHRCYPCERCGYPVAFVRLGRETRVIDCYRDEVRSSAFALAWRGDVLSVHECMGACQ